MDRYKDLGNREVEAIQLLPDTAAFAHQWTNGTVVQENDPFTGASYVGINVPTMDGKKRASEGDYIFKDARGIFTVMKPGQFQAQFERV